MRFLRRFWQGLRRVLLAVGGFLGRINNFILLSVAYYLLLFPIAWVRRTFSRQEDPPGWIHRESVKKDHFEKQF